MHSSSSSRTTILIGSATGLLSGLMGIGGGVIMVPLMVHFLPLTQHVAHGTSLAVVVFTGLASAIAYGFQGSLNLLLAAELALGTVTGARIGALWMNRISAARLRQAFGFLLGLVGLRMILPLAAGAPLFVHDTALGFLVTVSIGLIVGILSGLLGVGGGVFLVPAMVLLLGIQQQEAQGVSLAVVVPTSIIGAYTHSKKGNVATERVPWLTVPAVLLALVGSYFAHSIPGETLKQGFGVMLTLVGAQMVLTKGRTAQPAVAKPET